MLLKHYNFQAKETTKKIYLISLFSLFSRAKMKSGEYESLEQIDADLSLMFENAKRYNMPNSSIYKRAFRLQQIVQVCTLSDLFLYFYYFYLT